MDDLEQYLEETEAILSLFFMKKQQGTAIFPIIVVTANAFDIDIERCKKAGMDDRLSKPFNG